MYVPLSPVSGIAATLADICMRACCGLQVLSPLAGAILYIGESIAVCIFRHVHVRITWYIHKTTYILTQLTAVAWTYTAADRDAALHCLLFCSDVSFDSYIYTVAVLLYRESPRMRARSALQTGPNRRRGALSERSTAKTISMLCYDMICTTLCMYILQRHTSPIAYRVVESVTAAVPGIYLPGA